MLAIQKLSSGYGELNVLKSIDIHIDAGEIVALIGPNGAGKSTVIKSIFSLANKTGGKITFKGADITALKTHELIEEGISYVNQGKIIFGNLTVKENLLIGAELIKDKRVADENLKAVYQRFPALKQKEKELAFRLSGGQRQMLALGRALMQRPSLLLLDEPSLGLSPKLQKELFAIIESLKKDGIALLIVEQNAKKAIEIADRTYLLEDGNVVLEGGKDIVNDKRIQNVYLGGR